MVMQDLEYVFTTLDIECKGYIEWIELKEFDEDIYHEETLDIEQLEAAIETVCGPNSNGRCPKEYFSDLAKELERRHVMVERIRWDFRALDSKNTGRLSLETTLLLFKVTHNDRFSDSYWQTFLDGRKDRDAEVCLDEVILYLCNIPEYVDATKSDEEYARNEQLLKNNSFTNSYNAFKQLNTLQETDEYLAKLEKEKVNHANRLKRNASNLLNRMEEIGIHALLEDDFGDAQNYGGRPKEKVTATELLNALRDKYIILRDQLLLKMLRSHIGEGMWQALSPRESEEKLYQLKMKEEKLRKEGKLETMAIHLPGSRLSVSYNVFSLMGESIPELEHRIADQQEKIRESGLSMEEVVREFGKKLNDKEKLNSSGKDLLLDLNNRYLFEKETLTKKLQGMSGFQTLTASDREKILFSLVQAILRGGQEKSFVSCASCVGLSERVQPRNHDRSVKDPEKQTNLSSNRVTSFKDRRSMDGPALPARLYPLKPRLGRLDIVLELAQDSEHRLSLEREFLLNLLNSKEVLHNRITTRKLPSSERESQLSVLCAQWQSWRNKPSSEKLHLRTQIKTCLQEAVALKFESVKDEMNDEPSSVISDNDASVSLLSMLQVKQDEKCQKLLNVNLMMTEELETQWTEEKTAIEEEWNDNVAAIIFGIVEVSDEEAELLNALQNKYDALKDKLLMQSLMDQYGKAEWDKLSEKERQRRLLELRLREKKLRKEGKYDELAKLLGDSAANTDLLNKQLGKNRENYLNQLNERLRNRQRRIDAGEDPDDFEEELMDEEEYTDGKEKDLMGDFVDQSSGNILKDLDKRFDDEKDALLKRLREGNDRDEHERRRQAELMRLRLEARKAGRESNFDSAALVLGLAERNAAALEDQLKGDRERQEQLAKARLEARRQRKRDNQIDEDEEVVEDKVEPLKNNVSGWQDLALKELARTHEKEYNLFSDMLQDGDSEDLRQEAREMTSDGRHERLNKLKEKRRLLDLGVRTDQEEHMSIMEMAASIKYVIWDDNLRSFADDIDADKIIIQAMANLQELHDEETRKAMELIPNMNQEELVNFRDQQLQYQNEVHLENVAKLVFKYEGAIAKDEEFVKALDQKYDALLDKLALEALEKQMGEAEWQKLSEKERQAAAMKLKLQQKRLMKEGKLDEAAKLLGEGFKCEANVKKLMGESRKRYDELLKERLENRKKRIAAGEPVSDTEEELNLVEEFDEISTLPAADSANPEDDFVESTSAKALLSGLQERYDEEKEALLARLQGADNKFMSERERQAELVRLKQEQRKAQKEGRFDTAAMMMGLAERNKAEVDAKLSNDRARQEAIAKQRLEALRKKKAEKAAGGKSSDDVDKEEDIDGLKDEEKDSKDKPDIYDKLMKLIEKRQTIEQEELAQYLQDVDENSKENALLMTRDARNDKLNNLKASLKEVEDVGAVYSEMATIKMVNRMEALQSAGKIVSNDDLIISIMADLQQKQNEEDEEMIKTLKSTHEDEIPALRNQELQNISLKIFPQLVTVLASPDEVKVEEALVGALETKYDVLKDKLILDALEKQMGEARWMDMNEKERQHELMRIKLEQKRLKKEGKMDEASKMLNDLLQTDTNVQALLGSSKAEQEKRLKDRLAKRKMLKAAGMNNEEILVQEEQEDKNFEVEVAKRSTGNAWLDLEKNFELEKNALMDSLKNADSKLVSERQRQLELARLRRDAKKIQAEEKFGAAAMMMGMAKSQQAAVEAKMKSDRSRQMQLAKERLEARKNKRLESQQQQPVVEEVSEEDKQSDDLLVLHNRLLNLLEQVQSSERNFFMELLQAKDSEFNEKATQLPNKDRQKRLFVLNELHKKWRESPENPDDQIKICQEAIWLRVKEMGSSFDLKDDEVFIRLLADLQDYHDRDAALTTQGLAEKDNDTLKKLIEIQENALNHQLYDNLALVLLDTQGLESSTFEEEDKEKSVEDELTNALKEKYDALKDKIFEEAAKGKFDEETWNAMSEKEKEEHIANMKAEEHFKTDGDEGELGEVLLPSMDMTDQGPNVKKGTDILKDLEKQFEAEKDALLSSLRNADAREVNERERQLKLALLRRDKKRIMQEEKFGAAAMLMGKAKSQQAAVESKMKSDRSRQMQLAKERLEARKNKRLASHQQQQVVEEVTEEDKQSNDLLVLHGSLLNLLEQVQSSERNFFMELSQEKDGEFHKKATSLPNKDRQKRLFVLNELRKKFRESPENPDDQIKIFKEAIWLRVKEMGSSFDLKDDEVFIRLLADLQDYQDREAALATQGLAEKDNDTLKKLIEIQENGLNRQLYDNLALVLLDTQGLESSTFEEEGEEKSVEDELTNALKEKYDALKDKIFEEAAKGKFDEETWNAMSEEEKEEHIANMKAEEHFKTDGDEGDLGEVLLPSMDMTDQKPNVKKGTDILKDLEKQFEAEKDALLSSLRNADAKNVSERERQLKLALLRRDKKRIKQEEKFGSAALLMNAAKENESQREKSYKDERARQEAIARERIAARQRRKKEKAESQGSVVEEGTAAGKRMDAEKAIEKLKEEEETNQKQDLEVVEKIQREGTIALRESVLMEMEEKHYAEQDKLYELIQLTTPEELITASKMEPDRQNEKLNLISLSRKKFREQIRSVMESQTPETMNEEEKMNFNKLVTKGRAQLARVLKDGLVVTLVIKSDNLGKSLSSGELDEEISVSLLADLQELQTTENNALVKALTDCERDMVERLKGEQRKSRLAGYLDNLAMVVFKESNKTKKEKKEEAADVKEMQDAVKKIENEGVDQLKQLQKEMEEKKQMLPTMTGEDMDKFMNELQRQEQARRKAINDQVAKQQVLAKQKLMDKMKKRDEKLQESQFVNSMIQNAEKRSDLMREKTLAVQGTQKDALADRLARRRDARKQKEEEKAEQERQVALEAEKEATQEKEVEGKMEEKQDGDETKPESEKQPVVKKRKPMPPLPGGGLKREKTVVEKAAEISDNKKQEMINMLMREQTSLALKINSEQSRQEEQVRLLREKRKKKMEARETEAAAVLGLGARQKTIVEEHKKGERERQITQIRERVARIKEERNSARSQRELAADAIKEGETGEEGSDQGKSGSA